MADINACADPSQSYSCQNQDLEEFLSEKFVRRIVREWCVDMLKDTFPMTRGAYTCWNMKTGGRQHNQGDRIDVILVSEGVEFEKCNILTDVGGSDHCPVSLSLPLKGTIDASQTVQTKRHLKRARQSKLTFKKGKKC